MDEYHEDGLYEDGSEWINVQEPVRRTFDVMTKIIRDHELMTSNTLKRAQESEKKVDILNLQMARMMEIMEAQNSTNNRLDERCNDLNKRIDTLGLILDGSQLKQADQLYGMIQGQIGKISYDIENIKVDINDNRNNTIEMNNKISLKANQRELDDIIPFKIDESSRKLSMQINDLRENILQCALKEDITQLASSKVSNDNLREMNIELSERVTRIEMQESMNDQLKPIVNAVASLEKAVQFVEEGSRLCREDVEILRPLCSRATATADAARLQILKTAKLDRDAVAEIIDDILRERNIEVTPKILNSSLQSLREQIDRDYQRVTASLADQAAEAAIGQISNLKQQIDGKLLEMASSLKNTNNQNSKIRSGVKEMASNVAKALSKKADKSDMRRFVRDYEEHERTVAANTTAAAVNVAKAAVYGVPLPQTHGGEGLLNSNLQNTGNISTSTEGLGGLGLSQTTIGIGEDGIPLGEKIGRITEDNKKLSIETNELKNYILELRAEVIRLERRVDQSGNNNSSSGNVLSGSISVEEFQTALDDKCSRDEMIDHVKKEMMRINQEIGHVQKSFESSSIIETEKRMENVEILLNKISGESFGARYLWTKGILDDNDWILWDVQAANYQSSQLSWSPGSTTIRTKMPGLYRITLALFTTKPVVAQVCLNWQPLLSIEPPYLGDENNSETLMGLEEMPLQGQGQVMRSKHPAGDVTCITIDEFVSLPSESLLAVRFQSPTTAQAMFIIKKI